MDEVCKPSLRDDLWRVDVSKQRHTVGKLSSVYNRMTLFLFYRFIRYRSGRFASLWSRR